MKHGQVYTNSPNSTESYCHDAMSNAE